MRAAWLYDFYGNLLTEKQRNMVELYYHQDLSLSEIADLTGVSRQAIHDAIKRSEISLEEYEEKLGYLAYHFKQTKITQEIEKIIYSLEIDEENRQQLLILLTELLKIG